ncbi:MAG: hypothetical protein ABIA47_02665 [bacterium]
MIGRIIIGLLVAALGVLMVFKTPWFLSMIGRVAFAEKFFGGGGTRFFLKLLGIAIAVIGLLVVTDLWDNFILWVLGPLVQR